MYRPLLAAAKRPNFVNLFGFREWQEYGLYDSMGNDMWVKPQFFCVVAAINIVRNFWEMALNTKSKKEVFCNERS